MHARLPWRRWWPIAVGPVRGDLNGKFGDIRLRQFAVGAGLFHGRADGIPQFSGRLLHEFRHLYFLPPDGNQNFIGAGQVGIDVQRIAHLQLAASSVRLE